MCLSFCNIPSKFYRNFTWSVTNVCLRGCLRIRRAQKLVYTDSQIRVLVGRRQRGDDCCARTKNHSRNQTSWAPSRTAICATGLRVRTQTGALPDRPTDRLYCYSSRCLSFFPVCFVRFVSSSRLTRRSSRYARYVMSQVSLDFRG